MILNRLRLNKLRNHSRTDISCPDGVLLLLGENGAGKTTLLEAISLLCTSRSFVTKQDRSLVSRDAEQFSVEGEFTMIGGATRHVRVLFPGDQQKKQIFVDHAALETVAEIIGSFPLVALTPMHRPITAGGPSERRSFIDFVISQVHSSYLMDLIHYRRSLRQRNTLLAEYDGRLSSTLSVLDVWDVSLAECAVRILKRRFRFISDFIPFFREALAGIVGEAEQVDAAYTGSMDCDPFAENAVESYVERLRGKLAGDIKRGTTSIGPHRDDISIRINGLDVRTQASQGQHKSVLIALKLAEYGYLDEHLDERPLLLLDDVFGELDNGRLEKVLQLLGAFGQTFITSATESALEYVPNARVDCTTLRIEAGDVFQPVGAA